MSNTPPKAFPGDINAYILGKIMKEIVRRIIAITERHRLTFEVTEKDSKTDMPDFFTNADVEAQERAVQWLQECFPTWGIVAEEADFTAECSAEGCDIFFTLDPIDGTKAFIRKQSHGIGCMLSLVYDGEVIASYIGDINTKEMYGYRPESRWVYRISQFTDNQPLEIVQKPLASLIVSLRDEPGAFSEDISRHLSSKRYGGLFSHMEVSGGSIGIHMARLWKGEVGAILLRPGSQNPWDYAPITGINRRLGFKYVLLHEDGPRVMEDGPITRDPVLLEVPTLVIHENAVSELLEKW
ncbi:MAG TPA: inositol monophosphatase family protein [Verrucomicrobiae bacterium]|nr:inositol monophosphatase family protein [Verrucomicrobiae bacterium]